MLYDITGINSPAGLRGKAPAELDTVHHPKL